MINSFDHFFLRLFPKIDSNIVKAFSSISAPSLNLVVFGLLTLILFIKHGNKVFEKTPTRLFILTGLVMFFCGIIKITAGRARPYLLEENISGFFTFMISHSYLSFPSSHSALATAFAHTLKKKFSLPAPVYLYPIAIGASRLVMRKHFATDVLAGVLIGLFTSFIVVKHYDRLTSIWIKIIPNLRIKKG